MCDIKKIIENNSEIMTLLEIIQSFQLRDCWLCAGTIRNYIWNLLSGKDTYIDTQFSDIDVIFFDKNISYEQTIDIEEKIKKHIHNTNGKLKINII